MQWYCEPHIPFKQYSYLLDNSNFPGRLQWEVLRNLSQIAFPLLLSSMCWLPCSEFKNLYFFTTNEYSNVKQLSWTINYSSRCSRSSVDYVSSLVHTAALDREQALCVIEVNKCNYLYCLVAAKSAPCVWSFTVRAVSSSGIAGDVSSPRSETKYLRGWTLHVHIT